MTESVNYFVHVFKVEVESNQNQNAQNARNKTDKTVTFSMQIFITN